MAGKSNKVAAQHPIHASTRIAPIVSSGMSTREYVYQCITAAAPGAAFDDDSILSAIPVIGDDIGVCLNYRIPLVGANAWRSQEIQGSWTVDTLTARTDYRRTHP
jgi:hypothetical protein